MFEQKKLQLITRLQQLHFNRSFVTRDAQSGLKSKSSRDNNDPTTASSSNKFFPFFSAETHETVLVSYARIGLGQPPNWRYKSRIWTRLWAIRTSLGIQISVWSPAARIGGPSCKMGRMGGKMSKPKPARDKREAFLRHASNYCLRD